jgi:hypothetical protein
MYKNKYLKYKNKYINLKNQIGGSNVNCLYLDDTLTYEKIINFKHKLDYRTFNGLKNWLVIYAGYNTETEMIRFKDPNWIFWDLHKDDRYSIKGLFNEDNLMKLDGILSNTFDYICFDDDVNVFYKDDKQKLIFRLFKILKPPGFLVIKNMMEIVDIQQDNNSDMFFLSKKSISTPHGIGYGGNTTLDKIFNIIVYIKNQNIETINLLEYNNICKLIGFLDEQFINKFSNCKFTLKMMIKNIAKIINPGDCEEFLEKYKAINNYYDTNKEILKKEYQELLGKVTNLWILPTFSDNIEDRNTSELFIIKKNDYSKEEYNQVLGITED